MRRHGQGQALDTLCRATAATHRGLGAEGLRGQGLLEVLATVAESPAPHGKGSGEPPRKPPTAAANTTA